MSQVPTNYYLFSVTLKIDGVRQFRDIPIYSHKLLFPKREDVFRITLKFFGISEELTQEQLTELWVSFGVMNIFKFECQEDYLSYLGELQIKD